MNLEEAIKAILHKNPAGSVIKTLLSETDRNQRDLERRAAQGDEEAKDKLALNRIRIGQLYSFIDYIVPPSGSRMHWTGPTFGTDKRYLLSAQATNATYCTPRQSGLDACSYTAWEIAIVDTEKGLIPVLEDPEFATMPHRQEWASDHTVAPYMAVARVQDIFNWLIKKFGRPRRPRP